MFFTYEYLNRLFMADVFSRLQNKTVEPQIDTPQIDDLMAQINEIKKKDATFFERFIMISAAMWSLDSNIKQHPQVAEDFNSVLKTNPHLDYGKKIKQILSQ